MKKWIKCISVICLLLVGTVACQSKKEQTLTIGASQIPHAEILENIKPDLEKQGVKLDVKVFQDFVLPNKYVEENQLDANFFQHTVWMNVANQEHGYHLVKVAGVHIEPIGAYSKRYTSLGELKKGSVVAIPNGTSEITRALRLLEKNKLIQLDTKPGQKTVRSVISNPLQLQFKLLESSVLPRVLEDVDLAVINTNYALKAGMNPGKDALCIEDRNSPYVNILVTKQGKEKDERILKLAKLLQSEKTKKWIEQKYNGAIVPSF